MAITKPSASFQNLLKPKSNFKIQSNGFFNFRLIGVLFYDCSELLGQNEFLSWKGVKENNNQCMHCQSEIGKLIEKLEKTPIENRVPAMATTLKEGSGLVIQSSKKTFHSPHLVLLKTPKDTVQPEKGLRMSNLEAIIS